MIPDEQQIEVIEYTLEICRSVWNYALIGSLTGAYVNLSLDQNGITMENSAILDKIMLVVALLILGGGFFILFQGVFAMGKEDKHK